MKLLLDTCISKSARDYLAIIKKYEQDLKKGAIITVDKRKIRIRIDNHV